MYLEKFNLNGRNAVVTGGARGIGLACSQALAEAGARVIILDREADLLKSSATSLQAKGYVTEGHLLDVTKPDDVTAMADALVAKHGAIQVLVNCAGIARSGFAAEDVPDELWLNVNDVNYNGVFWCCRAFGRHMLKAGKGAIVNIGSMSGYIVNRPQKQSYYNASKAAVHHLTASLATEWAPFGVRVNAVAPTYIETPMIHTLEEADEYIKIWLRDTPMGRLGQPDEIASVVHFLASDASSLVTGETVLADGGFVRW
jgi:NAD(P)-dependent dehydrogenase (short-subunit alcohol dehydrogenase family)